MSVLKHGWHMTVLTENHLQRLAQNWKQIYMSHCGNVHNRQNILQNVSKICEEISVFPCKVHIMHHLLPPDCKMSSLL